MTIVILNDFAYVDGGASKIALGSAVGLARRGHRVILFTAVGPIDPKLEDVTGLTVHCLGQSEIISDPNRLHAALRGLWNRTSAEAFRHCLMALDPRSTVIHLHTWTKALSASVVRTALRMGFRLVLTMHDFFSVCPAGSFFIHPKQQICSLRPMSAQCIATNCDSRSYGQKLWRVGRHFLQTHPGMLPTGVRNFISISALSEDMIAQYLPADSRVHRLPNFIDVEQEAPAEVALSSAFTYIGRLSPEKGPALLASCAAELDLNVVFAGDGSQRGELTALAPNATFTGWISATDVTSALRRSRALVFPSLWAETQGLVVAEAAAVGVPAIVPSTSAAREWVEDNRTGLIFEGGNRADLARKIVFLRDNPDVALAFGREAYRRYWQRPMTVDNHCESLETMYSTMLQSPA